MTEYLNFQIDFQDAATVTAYDEVSLWSAMFGLMLLRHVQIRPSMRVLDVGCGTGFPLLELAQRLGTTCSVYGIDPWEAALNRARAKMETYGVKNVQLMHGDAASMPFSNGEFDLIVSNLGVNNFDNPDAVLAECHRVLKPAAKIALTTNLVGHMKEFYDVFESTLLEAADSKAMDAFQKNVNHRATMGKLESMLTRNGFQISQVHQETGLMRFADGTALLNHYFVKLGFLDGWKGVLELQDQQRVFTLLEANLNELAKRQGGLDLTIPMAYIDGTRSNG